MSAQAFGARLLSEVKEENLNETVREVRSRTISNASSQDQSCPTVTGIGDLDDIIKIFDQPPVGLHVDKESGEDVECQLDTRDGGQAIVPSRHPVIEITSPDSGDGKTSLMYYITAVGILPTSINGVTIGGKGSAVIFLDTDGRFDAARLRGIVLDYVREKLFGQPLQSLPMIEAMIDASLQHVHVFHPQSSQSLLTTIQSLHDYLLNTDEHQSVDRPLHAIILDSASAFYWQDRRETELLGIPVALEERSKNQADTNSAKYKFPRHIDDIANDSTMTLLQLQCAFSCPVIYTVWGYRRANPSSSHNCGHSASFGLPSFKPFLPNPWPRFPTIRLVVRRDPVRQFVPFIPLEQAKLEAAERHSMVERGKFTAWVDPWGEEKWPREITDALNTSDAGVGFHFTITKNGVRF